MDGLISFKSTFSGGIFKALLGSNSLFPASLILLCKTRGNAPHLAEVLAAQRRTVSQTPTQCWRVGNTRPNCCKTGNGQVHVQSVLISIYRYCKGLRM